MHIQLHTGFFKGSMVKHLFYSFFMSLLFTVSTTSEAQQVPLYSQYYLNPYIINPGYTGHDSLTTAFLLYRNQWAGIKGAPNTQLVSVNGRLGQKDMGFAGMFYNDQSNIYRRTGGYLSYSYRLPLNERQSIRVGTSLGVVQNSISFDKIEAESVDESTLLTNNQSSTDFDGSIGAVYTLDDRLEVGLSILQMFNSNLSYEEQSQGKSTEYRMLRHFYLSGKYRFTLKPNVWELSPLLLLRSAQGTAVQWDLGAQGSWKDLAWMTLMYRSNYGVTISAGGNINDNIKLGYAYEISTNGIGQYSKGTHEVVMSYTFKSRKNKNNHAATIDEERMQALENKVDSLETRLADHEEVFLEHQEEFDSVVVRKAQLLELVEKNTAEIAKKQLEIEALKREHEGNKAELNQFIDYENVNLAKLDTFNVNRWDYFVVIGTFTSFNYAKFIQKVFKRDYNLSTTLQKSPGKDYYMVWTNQVYTKKEAEQEIKKVNSLIDDRYIDQSAWLYHIRKTF